MAGRVHGLWDNHIVSFRLPKRGQNALVAHSALSRERTRTEGESRRQVEEQVEKEYVAAFWWPSEAKCSFILTYTKRWWTMSRPVRWSTTAITGQQPPATTAEQKVLFVSDSTLAEHDYRIPLGSRSSSFFTKL